MTKHAISVIILNVIRTIKKYNL